ncbi:MAG TPA: hypothetical protein VI485_31500 [Vicinamibacterales bacterium]|nr:hypothetical protein [Vicinamibacterales bacterium]
MEPARSERAAPSRDLNEFLVELSVALHRYSMYPIGHPALAPAIEAVVRRAEQLMHGRPSIAFGVARRQLVIDGVMTDPEHPVLRRLAESLHRHHIGAVSVMQGVQPHEISEALQLLATEADRGGSVAPAPTGQIPSWPHLKLHPLTFDGLAIVGDAPLTGDGDDALQASGGSELWIGLASAALSSDGSETESSVPTEPSAVARAIDDHAGAEAYDQVIVGYLVQIANELKTASGDTANELRRRTSRLIASLKPGTLRRLVAMGGNEGQREQFVLDATHGMAIDAVLEIVKAAADASGQTISHGLVRMLSKLATHAESGSDLARPRADVELREQVGRLLEDWRLEDPNPEAYGRVLQHLATSTAAETPRMEMPVAVHPEPLRIVQMCLEAGAFGPLAERAIDEIVGTGHVSEVLDLLTVRPEAAADVADLVLARLTNPGALKAILEHDPIDVASLDSLLPRLSLVGYQQLLGALASSESRATRRKLVDRLAKTELHIGALIAEYLEDDRWYVQRNMLVLLERSGRVPEGFSAVRWTTHPDARVRCEAIRLQLTLPYERELGIQTALSDLDPRVVRLGLAAVQYDCPFEVWGRVTELALAPESGDEMRLLAVTALGRIHHASVVDGLLHLADGGRSLLGRPRLPPKTPVLLAVIRALSESWSTDPRAATILALAAESPDPEVRDAVSPYTT